jgi:hypothetical protein
VEHSHPATEAAREALDQLRGEGDLGNEEQRLPAVDPGSLGGRQVDLGLAAAGDAVEQQLRIGPDRGQRSALGRRQRARLLRRPPGAGGLGEQPAVDPLPGGGIGAARATAPDPGREHGPDALQEGHPVVVGHIPRQLQLVGQEERLAIRFRDLLQLDAGILVGQCDDVAPDHPAAEGDEHPVARHDLHTGRDPVGVVTAVERPRGLHRDLGEPGQEAGSLSYR